MGGNDKMTYYELLYIAAGIAVLLALRRTSRAASAKRSIRMLYAGPSRRAWQPMETMEKAIIGREAAVRGAVQEEAVLLGTIEVADIGRIAKERHLCSISRGMALAGLVRGFGPTKIYAASNSEKARLLESAVRFDNASSAIMFMLSSGSLVISDDCLH